ncbi:MAG: helix-hairpin-helix domain-containing protein [Bacteroidota bacterium]|nr:helix-hairpin-helix domain-containing protein [Bacteroidota bacterium]MDP3146368.1 helix-hairpin-helix domain-containing protein [Bacteroidota bacterium]MDP3556340.1 helix-hairpin-helix domain-containing protein [Bacteroidota bacterium]
MASSFLNNYFGFNKQQRNGLLTLSLICLILLIVRIAYPSFIKPDNIIVENLPLVERKLDSSYESSRKHFSSNFSENKNSINLFAFDPNSVSFEQLLALGFKEKTAKTFLKFRERGFVFKQKSDIQKVYGISDNFFEKLKPYIIFSNKSNSENVFVNQKVVEKKEPQKTVKSKVDINTADSITLLNLDGIGPAFAKRILKYKSLLGGYNTIEQLKEVYGFTDELYAKLKPFIYIETVVIEKIDLNKDDFKTINKHPYLSYELTKSIFDWRRKTVITATNLKDIINDESVYKKLLPYLEFE